MKPKATTHATTLLVIDDDRKLCRLIADYLEPLGYEVEAAHTGAAGLDRAIGGDFDAVILDVMMPEMDGFEVLTRLRRHSDVPVLMLTARGEEADRIVGLEIGADDYLPKTFSSRELLARLRAVLRRNKRTAESEWDMLSVRELLINMTSRTAALSDQPLTLTPIEFDLLAGLVASKGRVKSREQLLESIVDRNYDVFDRSIDVHISSIRRKLNDDAKSPRFIRTVRSVGYMCINPDSEIKAS